MMQVFAQGHDNLAGLRALLELFAGPSKPCTGVADGVRLSGFAAADGADLVFISELGEAGLSLYLADTDGASLTKARLLERVKPAPDLKRQIKRQFYRGLSDLTGIVWPWGSLTGIRPTYIAAELLAAHSPAESLTILRDDYRLKEEKAELALVTAQKEEALLAPLPAASYAAYIGVPFCPTRCSYCSFTTVEAIGRDKSCEARYMKALEREIEHFLSYAGQARRTLQAVYIGGGTPAALNEEHFAALLALARRLPLAADGEITVEAGRADVLNERKLKALKTYGIKRICLNPQTLNEKTLRRVGRRGTIQEIRALYALARKYGISTINLDLIAGLDEDETELISHVRELLTWEPESITLHTLALKKGSAADLRRQALAEEKRIMPEPRLEAVLTQAQTLLRAAGLEPYYLYRQKFGRAGLENVAFAQAGHSCLYNIMMMSDRYPVISFGSPAMSKAFVDGKLKRLPAAKSLNAYLDRNDDFLKRKAALFLADAQHEKGSKQAEGAER